MHLKNNIFHTLSYSECKEILESPAKYILNYENDYRKGYDRYYMWVGVDIDSIGANPNTFNSLLSFITMQT